MYHGEPLYQFQIAPDMTQVPDGDDVAYVWFKFHLQTGTIRQYIAGPPNFRMESTGTGCVHEALALVEYKTPTRESLVIAFDECKLVTTDCPRRRR